MLLPVSVPPQSGTGTVPKLLAPESPLPATGQHVLVTIQVRGRQGGRHGAGCQLCMRWRLVVVPWRVLTGLCLLCLCVGGQYRLGVLGFMKVEGGDYNVGLWDQVRHPPPTHPSRQAEGQRRQQQAGR